MIPTWRKAVDALQAVQSLRSGCLRPDRILLLDNGSGADTLRAMQEGTAGMAEVEVVGLEENLGFSRAVNRGIDRALEAGATHVLLMNDDAVVDRGCVEMLWSALEEDASAGIAAPRIFYHADPERVWHGEAHYSRARTTVVQAEKNRLASECRSGRRSVTAATGCVQLVRREVYERAGVMEEAFYFYEEDVEFARRALDAGFGVVYVPEARAYHKIGNVARDRTSPFVLYHLARSRVIRLRLAGGIDLPYGIMVHLLAYTPFRLCQVWRGSRSVKAAAAWFRGTLDGLTEPLRRSAGMRKETRS